MSGEQIGRDLPRRDAEDKLRGRTRYAIDRAEAGMLHGALARADVAAGRIARIDASAALAMPVGAGGVARKRCVEGRLVRDDGVALTRADLGVGLLDVRRESTDERASRDDDLRTRLGELGVPHVERPQVATGSPAAHRGTRRLQ